MKKVKKLNEDLIRKLIIETIDEVALGEGRKKKVEEADETDSVHSREDTGTDTGAAPGENSQPTPEQMGIDPNNYFNRTRQNPPYDVKQILDAFATSEKFFKSGVEDGSQMGVDQARQALQTVLDLLPKPPKKTN